MEKNIISKEFEGTEIQFKMDEQGQSFVRIDEVAKFCGWTTIAKSGNQCIRWARVNEKLELLGIANVGNGDFIPENIMYPLIGMADFKKNPKAREFMLWVGQVLTQLRQTGVIITEKATEDAIDFEKKYGIYRIRKTFTKSENMSYDYNEFLELAKENKLNGQERIKRLNIIFDSIQNRYNNTMSTLKGSQMLEIQELLTQIKSDTLKLSNKVNGGIKTGQTKLINKQQQHIDECHNYINYIDPDFNEYTVINKHGFTENCIYGTIDNCGNLRFSKAYNVWRATFPKKEFPKDIDIDFNKPVLIWLYFDHKQEFDVTNFSKSFIDMICLNYGVDDHNVQIMRCCTNKIVNDYKDGKIYYFIKNAEEK